MMSSKSKRRRRETVPADHIADNAIFPASKMGFGCMRLPLLDKNDPKSIDMPQFEQMVDAFMEAGNTYFDTAFVYHEGESEVALGKALVARYPRESFTIATKCLAWALPNKEAAQECLDVSLKRLGTDYVDYYLLHNVGGKRTAKFDEYDMWDFAQEQKAAWQDSPRGLFHTRRRGVLGPAAHRPSGDGLRAATN